MVKLPDFIIIGAGKAGTTSLHRYLSQHPGIYLCPQKETFFFINERSRRHQAPWGALQTFEEYRALFAGAPAESIVGEISTNYYAYPESAELIHQTLPEVKILAILRNPIDRAFSSYQMHVNDGVESRDFKDVMTPDIKYINRGFYYSQLQPYYRVFPPEHIRVLLYDDYCQDALGFMRGIFEFVGVDPTFQPDMTQRGRVGGVPKRRWLHTLLQQHNPMRSSAAALLRLLMPLEARQKLRSRLIAKNTQRLRLDDDCYAYLADLYRDEVLQLQTLLGRDLSHWLER